MSAVLGYLARAVGLLAMLLVAGLAFLLFTEAGAGLALRQVETRLGYVHAQGLHGALWGPIHFAHFRYEDAYVRVELEDVTLDWAPLQALRRRIAVSQLQAALLRVEVKARADRTGDAQSSDAGALTRLPFGLDVRALRIARFNLLIPHTEALHFDDVAIEGSWIGDQVALSSLAAVTPWVGALQVAGTAQLHADGVDVAGLKTQGFAEAAIEGRLGYGMPSDLRVHWTALRWPPDGEIELASDGGSLRWQGIFDDWHYTLDGVLAVAGERLQIDAQGQGSLSRIVAERIRVDSGHGAFAGTAAASWRDTPTIEAAGRIERVQPQHWLAQLDGELNGEVQARAAFAGDAPVASFTVRLSDSRLQDYPLQLVAAGSYAVDTLRLQRFDLRSGPSRIQASGQAWPTLALSANVESRDLASLWPPLTGRTTAQVTLSGPPQLPRVTGTLKAGALRFAEFAIGRVELSADVDPRGDTRLDAELGGIQAGTTIDVARLRLRGSASSHRLSVDATTPQGSATLIADGAAEFDARRWSGTITQARFAPKDLPVWTLEEATPLKIDGAAVELDPACFESEFARACVALRPVDDGRRLAFRLDNVRLAALDPWMPGGARLDGRLDGQGYVDLNDRGLGDLRLELHGGASRLLRGDLPPLAFGPLDVLVEEQAHGLVLSGQLPFERGGLRLSATLAAGAAFMHRRLDGELQIELPDLSWLELLNRELDQVKGHVDGRIALAGTLAAPQFAGSAQLSDGGLRLRTPGLRLERVTATLSGTSEGQLVVDAQAWSDGGALRIDGTIDPWATPALLQLKVRGDNFQALRRPDAVVWISPDLTVRMARRELHVDGTVVVPRATITPKTIDQGVGPSADQVIVRRGEQGAQDRLGIFADIRLRLGEQVRFDGLGLKTQLTGAVQLQEAPGVPTRARGELQLVGGRYKAYGQDLTLETGRLLFTGGALTRPAVELRATRKPREDITVGVLVRGTLDQPEFSLFSTPAMPQERQLAWLVLGRSLDEATGSGADRALVADAALSLGLAGGEWLAQRFGGRLGIDEISVGARPGETSEQARLTIGKYLSPRLLISYGVALFQPGYTFRLQYDIGHGFKLATETGVESGGDVLYTIER